MNFFITRKNGYQSSYIFLQPFEPQVSNQYALLYEMVQHWQKMIRTFVACSMSSKRFHNKEAFLFLQLSVHLAENLAQKSFEHLLPYIFRLSQVFLPNYIPLSTPKNEEYPHLKQIIIIVPNNMQLSALLLFIPSIFGLDIIPTGILNIPRQP